MARFDWCGWLWRAAIAAAFSFGMSGSARAAFYPPVVYTGPTGYACAYSSQSQQGGCTSLDAARDAWVQRQNAVTGLVWTFSYYVTNENCTVTGYPAGYGPGCQIGVRGLKAGDNGTPDPIGSIDVVATLCPANSELVNGQCQCTGTNLQTTTNGVITCGVPPTNNCAPDGQVQDANTTTRYSIPGTGSTACHQGCLVVFEYQNGAGANRWATGPAYSMGLPCTPGGQTTPDAAPQTPEQNSCPVGQCPGTVNGASVCVLCSVSHNDVQPPPTGASGVPGTTTTTTVNPDGTVTTETRNPDGTTSSSSSPGLQVGMEAYCTRNPMAFICSGVPGGDNGSAAPGAPGGAASGVPGSTPTITSPNATAAPSTLYTKKYPDGLMGVWNAKREALQNSGLASAITSLVPSLGSGGCPSMDLPGASIMGLQFGGGSVAPPCWVWTMVQAVMMVTALIAARRLIFGG